ncbi:hypothetical protein L0665_01240 [Methanogenium marinum]|uniref:Uncharacterized protein n=1 Tax=Methanogenium marinum TaxID=348610 RepID=A0A9Q4KU29_9EURY|nr:hypothetical protein [Methanogenium marinum]MDE4907251.1 hypothetical protein [Methanogenium marinum]
MRIGRAEYVKKGRSSLISEGEYPGNSPLVKNGNRTLVFTTVTKNTEKTRGGKFFLTGTYPFKSRYGF